MALFWVIVAVVGLVIIDRLLLAAERRGWVYYRKRKPVSGAATAMLAPVAEVLQPGRQVVVEQTVRERTLRRTDEASDPADPTPDQDDADR